MRVGQPGTFNFGNGPKPAPPRLITSSAEFDAIDWEQPNQNIKLESGLVLRGKTVTEMAAGISIGAFGTGDKPCLIGSTLIDPIATPWTNTAGNIWKSTLASAPSKVFERIGYTINGMTTLRVTTGTQTAPGVGEFGHASGELYICSTTDPNLKNIEHVTYVGVAGMFTATSSNTLIEYLTIIGSPQNAIVYTTNVDGGTARLNDVYGSCNDGIDGALVASPPKNILIQGNRIWANGFGPYGAGATGDGISFHSQDYSCEIVGNDIRYNNKSGIGNQCTGVTLARGNYLQDNWDNIAVYGASSVSAPAVPYAQKFHYNVLVHTSGQNRGYIQSGAGVMDDPLRVELYNNVIKGCLATGKRGLQVTNSAITNYAIANNIITGWTQGMDDNFNLSTYEILNNNCLNGNTLNYYDNGTNNLVNKVGAQSITSDPLFTNPGAGDFTLQAGSPCTNAGVDVGLTSDYAGNAVGSPPDIGAYEKV